MKVKLLKITLGIVVISLIISGCQPTPDNEVVVGKDNRKLDELINATNELTPTTTFSAVPENEEVLSTTKYITEPWVDQIDYKNDKTNMEVIVDINANITYPKDTTYPVLRIKEMQFSLEDAYNVKDFFMKDLDIYKNSMQKTKYDYMDDVIRFKSAIENIKVRTDITEEEKENEIKNYENLITHIENKISSAPSTLPSEPALIEFSQANSSAADAKIINVCSYRNDNKLNFMVLNVPSDKVYNLSWYISGKPYFSGQAEVDFKSNSKKLSSYLSLAMDTLEQLGINDMNLSAITAISNGSAPPANNCVLSDYDLENSCFVFHFMRSINSMPTVYANQIEGVGQEGVYAPVYESELIDISIDSSGIIEFAWQSPSEVIGIENENVNVLSLDEIKDTFKNQILISKTWSLPDSKKIIHINEVKYGMTRIAIKDYQDEYRYVPSWTFYGYEELSLYTSSGEKTTITKIPYGCYLTINAIDGSIIDRSLGY